MPRQRQSRNLMEKAAIPLLPCGVVARPPQSTCQPGLRASVGGSRSKRELIPWVSLCCYPVPASNNRLRHRHGANESSHQGCPAPASNSRHRHRHGVNENSKRGCSQHWAIPRAVVRFRYHSHAACCLGVCLSSRRNGERAQHLFSCVSPVVCLCAAYRDSTFRL